MWTAPGVLYVKIAGLYACCDVLLHQWLTYLPSPKLAADSASGVDRLEVTVDVGIAQATLPITSPTSRGSFCYRSTLDSYIYSGTKHLCHWPLQLRMVPAISRGYGNTFRVWWDLQLQVYSLV